MADTADKETTDTTDGGVDNQPADGVQSADKPDEAPAWFKPFAEEVRGKFTQVGKDLGRIRAKDKPKDTPKEGQDQPAPGVSREDMAAGFQLVQALATIPAEAAAMIQEQVEDGTSYAQALLMAQLAKTMAPENGTKTPKTSAEARRQAPTKKTPPHPKSVQEFLELQARAKGPEASQADKDRYKSIMDDDDFNVNELPQYLRR